ncbi:MAG: MBL fold metallo-hydrolase [Alphaproteobacteria bacterium]|nr:MBL fold metallo-hydrolase [Alphaproteobacteria bacterium]
MILEKVEVTGILTTNSYFYIDEKTQCGFLIDPGAEAEKLLNVINQKHWHIEAVLLTHGHFDHIGVVQKVCEALAVPYYAHENAQTYLTDPQLNLSAYMGKPIILDQATYVKAGDVIALKDQPEFNLRVIDTPGHTTDSIVYYSEKNEVAFVGDTIFKGSVGATHFPGGNEALLWRSIRDKILTLPDQVRLYPGHFEATSVGAEKNI